VCNLVLVKKTKKERKKQINREGGGQTNQEQNKQTNKHIKIIPG
jgi:hypothetical protein